MSWLLTTLTFFGGLLAGYSLIHLGRNYGLYKNWRRLAQSQEVTWSTKPKRWRSRLRRWLDPPGLLRGSLDETDIIVRRERVKARLSHPLRSLRIDPQADTHWSIQASRGASSLLGLGTISFFWFAWLGTLYACFTLIHQHAAHFWAWWDYFLCFGAGFGCTAGLFRCAAEMFEDPTPSTLSTQHPLPTGDSEFDSLIRMRGTEAEVYALLDHTTRTLLIRAMQNLKFALRGEALTFYAEPKIITLPNDQPIPKLLIQTVQDLKFAARGEALTTYLESQPKPTQAGRFFDRPPAQRMPSNFLDAQHAHQVLETLSQLKARLPSSEEELPHRLAHNVLQDPIAAVRLRNLRCLTQTYPTHPATQEALQHAFHDESMLLQQFVHAYRFSQDTDDTTGRLSLDTQAPEQGQLSLPHATQGALSASYTEEET